MLKGYYNLTSGMLTQGRTLDVISNNMTNVSTPGFKKDVATATTFEQVLQTRTGNMDRSNRTELGNTTMITTIDEVVTNYGQSSFDNTNRIFDFGLYGNGFFTIETANGPVYTRNGNFTLDDEGYLTLQHVGRVVGADGPLQLNTDQFTVGKDGIFYDAEGEELGSFALVDFNDYAQLTKYGEGMFTNANQANIINEPGTNVIWKSLERSNVSAQQEMVAMMTSQRALQSCSQVLKMYDQLIGKIVTEIGRL